MEVVAGFERGGDEGNKEPDEAESEKLGNAGLDEAEDDELANNGLGEAVDGGAKEAEEPNSDEGALGVKEFELNGGEAEAELAAETVAANKDAPVENGTPKIGAAGAVVVVADEDEANSDWDGDEPNRGFEAVEAEEPNRDGADDAAEELNEKEGAEAAGIVVAGPDPNPNPNPKDGAAAELGFEATKAEEAGAEAALRVKGNGAEVDVGFDGVGAPKDDGANEKPVVEVEVAGAEEPNGEADDPNENPVEVPGAEEAMFVNEDGDVD